MFGQPPMSRRSGSLSTSTGYVSTRTQVWLGTLFTFPSWPHLTEALVVSQSIGRSSRGSPARGRAGRGWSDQGVLEVDGAAADGHRVAGGVEYEVGLGGDLD